MEGKTEKLRVTATVKEVSVLEARGKKSSNVGYKITFHTAEGKDYSAYWPILGVSANDSHENMEQLRWLTVLILFDNEKITFHQLAKLIGKDVSLIITKVNEKDYVFAVGKVDESLYLIHSSFFHLAGKKATGVFFKNNEVEKIWEALGK